MTTNTELLKIAKKYLGYDGSIFRKFAGLAKGAPYCNAYVDYVADKGGVSKLYFDGKKVYTITEEEEKTKFLMNKSGGASFGTFLPYMTTDVTDAIRQRNSLVKSFQLNVTMLKE